MSGTTEAEALGPGLLAVLDDERARGNRAHHSIGQDLARGVPPTVQLEHAIDVDAVESVLVLGPRVAWWPRTDGAVDAVDLDSGAAVRSGTLPPRPPDAPAPSERGWLTRLVAGPGAPSRGGPPRRIGFDDEPGAVAGWPPLGAETDRLGTELAPPLPLELGGRAVSSVAVPAPDPAVVVARAAEAVRRLAPVLAEPTDRSALEQATPPWLAEAFAPDRDAAAWHRYGLGLAGLTPDAARLAARSAHWTAARWYAAMGDAERAWRWLGVVPDAAEARVAVVLAARRAPRESLVFLLHAARRT